MTRLLELSSRVGGELRLREARLITLFLLLLTKASVPMDFVGELATDWRDDVAVPMLFGITGSNGMLSLRLLELAEVVEELEACLDT